MHTADGNRAPLPNAPPERRPAPSTTFPTSPVSAIPGSAGSSSISGVTAASPDHRSNWGRGLPASPPFLTQVDTTATSPGAGSSRIRLQRRHPARGRGRTSSPSRLLSWMPPLRKQHLPLHFRQRPEAEVLLYAVLVRRVLTSLRRSGARSGPSGPYLATTYLDGAPHGCSSPRFSSGFGCPDAAVRLEVSSYPIPPRPFYSRPIRGEVAMLVMVRRGGGG
ncbi:uncharacterized protein [Triticum aestivum]|uniref:uncharacterized protein n=1 Tax=Triticum aestivum TaxID=4565 RepID=UPI001D01161E|nr:uncharacterized protein LOC123043910 [Triticum aestivum]